MKSSIAMNARFAALKGLVALEKGTFLQARNALEPYLNDIQNPIERHFASDIFYEVIRWKIRLDHSIAHFCRKDLPSDPYVLTILRIAAAEILLEKSPHYAVVDEAVKLAHRVLGTKAVAFTNALLRKLSTEHSTVTYPKSSEGFVSATYSFPLWLVRRWFKVFGKETAVSFCSFFNTPAALSIRLNDSKLSKEEILERLKGHPAMDLKPLSHDLCFSLKTDIPVAALKEFKEGLFTVQDMTQVMITDLLQVQEGDAVLDLCAGRGGKTCHVLQKTRGKCRIVSVDTDTKKLKQLEETAARLGFAKPEIVVQDIESLARKDTFDAVILDVPCSNIGTLRRRPELKWRLHESDFEWLGKKQLGLLRKAVTFLKDGGRLLYASCSIDPAETSDVTDTVCTEMGFIKEAELAVLPSMEFKGDCGYGAVLIKA